MRTNVSKKLLRLAFPAFLILVFPGISMIDRAFYEKTTTTEFAEIAYGQLNWEESVTGFSHTNDIGNMRSDINISAMREMISDLSESFPDRFIYGSAFLSKLNDYEKMIARVDELLKETPTDKERGEALDILRNILMFQREVALSNPILNANPILYVQRNQYAQDHHNTETLFHTGEPNQNKYNPGGALKLFHPVMGKTAILLDPGPEGLVRDQEVHFDGRKIVFSMRKSKEENYSIYELELDVNNGFNVVPGSFRRLTSEYEASDIDPLYLPDGKIIFSSTREPKYCHCNMHIMANLYRMDGDGANIHQISKNTLFDGHPSLLPDGRVLYYRWEYVDRNFGDAQGLWTVNPDGTNHAVYWGNNTVSPAAVFDSRMIPGTDRVICIFGSCHDRPWGALAIINRNRGIDSEEAVERIWPENSRDLISIDGSDLPRPFMEDHFRSVRYRYEDPFPLTDPETGNGGKYFLVSRNINYLPEDLVIRQSRDLDELVMGIYLVDIFGNEILLHSEMPGSFDPMPLAASPRSPIIPEQRNFTSSEGTMYVMNVYEGTHMHGVNPGEVAYLRVVESTEKRFWTIPLWQNFQYVKELKNGQIAMSITLNRPAISWAGFETKRILGTVPVEKDGSAYFELPAEKFVYFQLLDNHGMMISSMRSGTMVQPGEKRGCVGCHENRLSSPTWLYTGDALKRPPDKLNGWYGSVRTFCYMSEVQPVWDRNCVSCHDFGKKAGNRLVLARDKELVFNASYVELFQNWGYPDALIHTVGTGLAPINNAYSVGSQQSQLVKMLNEGHQEVELTDEEMKRIITWIDIGGPYYPEYASAHPDKVAGRAPLNQSEVKRLEELTGVYLINPDRKLPGAGDHKLWITFDRPELSPCLEKLDKNSETYKEALAIIEKGKFVLQEKPEADMPGFEMSMEHRAREEKYQRLRERELIRREAIAAGKKVYDSELK